jgi:hypothetical protein
MTAEYVELFKQFKNGGIMRQKILLVIIFVTASALLLFPQNLIAKKMSPDETKVSLKKASMLSKIVKLGDTPEIEFHLEKPVKGNYPVRIYIKDAEGKTVVASIVQHMDFIKEKSIYNLRFEFPENIPILSFRPDNALPHRVSIRIGESEEKDMGIIGLYRMSQFWDGIVLPGLHIPLYIIFISLVGSFGYVITSIYKKPLFTLRNIAKLLVRFILGPLYGIFIYLISNTIVSPPNAYVIGALCFATGFYISPIQTKMRDFVYDKLAPNKKLEDEIAELEADEAELISRISMSKRAAYYLKREGIISVADLSAASQEKLNSLAKSSGLDEEYLKSKKAEAAKLDKNNLSKLNIPLGLMNKLPKRTKYLGDLAALNISELKVSSEEQSLLTTLIGEAKEKII